jgi:AcrR family transcriptional regulator
MSATLPPAVPPETRTRILQTALELFSERGFDGTTLQQIADRLGFTKAALYYHFRSKDDLLQALLTPAMTGMKELLDAHDGLPNTPAQRRRFIEEYLDYLLRHRLLIAYMVQDLAALARPEMAAASADHRKRVGAMLVGDGLGFNEQIRVAMALRGIGGVIAQYPDADTSELREALLDATRALLRGGRRRPPATASTSNAAGT